MSGASPRPQSRDVAILEESIQQPRAAPATLTREADPERLETQGPYCVAAATHCDASQIAQWAAAMEGQSEFERTASRRWLYYVTDSNWRSEVR